MNNQSTIPSTPIQKSFNSKATGKSQNPLKSFSPTVWQRMGSIPYWISILLLAIVVLVGLFFGTTHASFARTTFSFETCANVPLQDKLQVCNGADPIQQGCTADAKTLFTVAVKTSDGRQVGWAQE